MSFTWPDDTPVFQDLSFTVGPGRTGLVAPNGTGKSTLLKLIAGELRPGTDSAAMAATLDHLPQSLPLTGELTVAEVLGITPVIQGTANYASMGATSPSTRRPCGRSRRSSRRTSATPSPAPSSGVPAPICPSGCPPAASGCAPPRPACCARSRPRTCCSWTTSAPEV
ncbi:ATP-binding cassette domain-containing protein [Streptomyces diastatochromogenes]|nr:ATP-binding cassette domain-containing protein [Streptomyces diastatochromogenes]